VGTSFGLLLSSEVAMLLKFLTWATHPWEDYRRRERKGYLMQYKFHPVCSRLPPWELIIKDKK
jgi:hypothetical protein